MQCSKCGDEFSAKTSDGTYSDLCDECWKLKRIIKAISKDHFAFVLADDLTEADLAQFMKDGKVRVCSLRAVAEDLSIQITNDDIGYLQAENLLFDLLYSIVLETLGAGNILGKQRETILAHFGITEAEKFQAPPSPNYPTFEQFAAGADFAHTPPLAYAAGYDHGFMDGQRRGPAPKSPEPSPPVEEPPPFVPPQPCGVSSKVEGGEMRCALNNGHPGDWHKDASGLEFQVRG